LLGVTAVIVVHDHDAGRGWRRPSSPSYHAAGLDDRVARVEQLSDAQLMRTAAGGRDEPRQRASGFLLLNPR